METCDVLVVGGGPAGSACAWALGRAGLDVLVLDAARFPRDKVCAGWITPQLVETLALDLAEYARGRTLQPFTGFRIGVIGRSRAVQVDFQRPVSYGIRRCEFDAYLLRRSRARVRDTVPVSTIRRDAGAWIVNESVRAPVLVGAAGHACPVARLLNGPPSRRGVVAAQEAEWPLPASAAAVAGTLPELYFCPDLGGYGWWVRKGGFVNLGLGRLGARGLPATRDAFVAFLQRQGRAGVVEPAWRGHAYLVSTARRPRVSADGVLLAGDAAGLAYPESGEGIRPAVESGLLAARTILGAGGRCTAASLAAYDTALRARIPHRQSRGLPAWVAGPLGRRLLGRRWFVRDLVVRRWFLRMDEPSLTPA